MSSAKIVTQSAMRELSYRLSAMQITYLNNTDSFKGVYPLQGIISKVAVKRQKKKKKKKSMRGIKLQI